jgi:hypothetical protein
MVDGRGKRGSRRPPLERHELLYMEPGPSCSLVLEPLRRLQSYKELMGKYGMRICGTDTGT